MRNFNFWQKWLLIVGIYLVVFGLFLTFFSQSSLMDFLFNKQIDPIFWANAELPENTLKFQGWIYGVLGAVIAGWGTLIAFWAFYPFKTRERWAWNGLAFGTGIWYCADTAISAIYGVTFNIVFNTIMLVLLATPLAKIGVKSTFDRCVSSPDIHKLERDLTSALKLAVVCEGVVWRGTAASPYVHGAQDFLEGLVAGPDIVTFPCHYSGSVSEQIARDFLYFDDDEKCISVLLRIESRTARYLRPFVHQALDEEEVVLL